MSQATMGHLRNDIKRSESAIGYLEGRGGLTPEGREWIIGAFDPFHDRDLDVKGLPDSNGTGSMVQIITMSAQVVGPSTTNPWACHIVDLPFMGPLNAKQSPQVYTRNSAGGAIPNGIAIASGNVNNYGTNFGGLSILTFNQSDNNQDIFGANIQTAQSLAPNITDLINPYRVIGKAFEVYNTSPDLYKSGAVCVYKQPAADMSTATTMLYSSAGGTSTCFMDSLLMEAPPGSVTSALRLPNSRQWDAKEGCYVITPLHGTDIPVHLANYTQPLYYPTTPGDVTNYGAQIPTNGSPLGAFLSPADQNFTNFDQTGAIFTGLTPQSTLTVNYRMIIEVFPSADSSLANFAHPSPCLDEVALELYSKICHRAPVGVEVKYNGLGDWFIDGINAVKDMVLPMAQNALKQSKHPAAQVLSAGLKSLTSKSKPKQDHGLGKISGRQIQGPLNRTQQDIRDHERKTKKKTGKKKK